MSSGPYDIPRPISILKEPRRAPPPLSYERIPPQNVTRSISPAARRSSFRSYDPPPRPEYPNIYRPNSYRPDAPERAPYYVRPLSSDHYEPADHYEPPPREPNFDFRERSNSWNSWPDRRTLPISPTISEPWDRPRRDVIATRAFEPSDTWKQTHSDPFDRGEGFERSSGERYGDIRRLPPLIPDPAHRNSYAPFNLGGDRYRPPVVSDRAREGFINGRADTYRPRYDEAGSHYSPPSFSSPTDSYRREVPDRSERPLPTLGPSRGRRRLLSTGQSDSVSFTSRSRSRSPSLSPPSREFVSKPRPIERLASTSRPLIYDPGDRHWSPAEPVEHRPLAVPAPSKSRSPSVSSIASTRASRLVTADNSPVPDTIREQILSDAKTEPMSTPSIMADEHSAADASPSFIGNSRSPNSTEQHLVVATSDATISDHVEAISVTPPDKAWEDSKAWEGSEGKSVDQAIPTVSHPPPHDLAAPSAECDTHSSINAPLELAHEKHVLLQDDNDSKPPTSVEPSSEHEVADPPEEAKAVSEKSGVSFAPAMEVDPKLSAEVIEEAPAIIEPDIDVEDDLSLESIPKLSEADSLTDALRIVVMTRKLCDRQTRDERVHPVLVANRTTKDRTSIRHEGPVSTSDELISKCYSGATLDTRLDSFDTFKPSLIQRFEEREAALKEKAERLRAEYIALHERWLAHCAALDEQAKPTPAEIEAVQPSGRTTRRSAAGLGDAVRSDLEMEQIIASLGNDDATDPMHLSMRNLAVVPDMLSVTHGHLDYVYNDTNHLVRDPHTFYAPHTGIDDWTDEEKQVFLEKFAMYPKQFGVIADFLPDKTASQCVEFYYLHKKTTIDFRKVISQHAGNKRRRRRTDKQKGNGLLADIRQHDDEVHRDSSSPGLNGRQTRRKPGPQPQQSNPSESRKRRTTALQQELTPVSTPTPEPEARTRRRRAAAQTAKTAIAAADEGDEDGTDAERRPAKRARRTRKVVKSAATVKDNATSTTAEIPPEAKPSVTEPTMPPWSEDDKNLFLSLVAQFGDNFKRIAASMPNKTEAQVSHFYKSSVTELDVVRLAARAPRRSATPDARHTQTQGLQYPGSGIMSPVMNAPSLRSDNPRMMVLPSMSPSEGRFHANPWIPTAFDVMNPPRAPPSSHTHPRPQTMSSHHLPPVRAPPMNTPGPSRLYHPYPPNAGDHMSMTLPLPGPPMMHMRPEPTMYGHARSFGGSMHHGQPYGPGVSLLPPFSDGRSPPAVAHPGHGHSLPSPRGNPSAKGGNPYPVVPPVRLHP